MLSNIFLVGGDCGVLPTNRQLYCGRALNWLNEQSRDIFQWWDLLDGEIMSPSDGESLLPEAILENFSTEHLE